MSGLSPRARALIEQARPAEEPSAEDRARMDRRLVALLAGATVTTAAGSGAAASGGAKLLSGAFVKTLLAALVVSGGVGVTAVVSRTTLLRDPTVVVSAEPRAPSGPAPLAPRASAAPSVASAAASAPLAPSAQAPIDRALPTPASATVRRPLAPPGGSTLLDEAAVLQRAQEAMRENDPERALAALDEHERRFGNGTLRQEREAARVIAWCRAGRTAEGRRAAASFLAEHPSSPLAARVRDACP